MLSGSLKNGWDQDGEQNNRDERSDAGKREVLSKGRGLQELQLGARRISQASTREEAKPQISTLDPSQQAAGSSRLWVAGGPSKPSRARTGEFCDWPAGIELSQICRLASHNTLAVPEGRHLFNYSQSLGRLSGLLGPKAQPHLHRYPSSHVCVVCVASIWAQG